MRLNHVRRGRGEPLVLIHPLGGELVVWEPVLDRLAAERDVIALDMPGFGSSPPLPGDEELTAAVLARAVAAFLDELGVERAHLAGNSLGAWVALELALLGRGLSVAGLGPAGLWSRPLGPRRDARRRLGRLLMPLVVPLARSERGRGVLLGRHVARPERVPPQAAARLARAYLTAPSYAAASTAMRAGLFSGLEQIAVPVTLAWGEHDGVVSRPRRALPSSVRTVTLAGCGHVPTWDDPEQVSGVLLEASSQAAAPRARA
ncbi:MAG TPA: alpha/beta fold hydrolase [Thermoleophilaceae bacterium]|nr:alpha/beta fold hydrolase [Thermoleophilaceae bacterium]